MDIVKRLILKTIFMCLRVFRIKNNKIVITSFYGKGYGDNSKYICNEILNRDLNLDIVWLVNDLNCKFPDGIRKVKFKSLKSFYELATAKIWIDNSRKHDYILKRKSQYYIQTWHSSLRLKKIEGDAINELPKDYVRNAKLDSKKMNLLTVGCRFSEEMYNRAFWYSGEMMRCGTPRCDLFFNETVAQKIKKDICTNYNINDKKIILYAPTFKKNYVTDDVSIDFEKIISELNSPNEKYVFFVRLHPISQKKFVSTENAFDFTNYPDMQELISICDYFITDYSGCCFDAMIAKKPCVLYTPDLEVYLKNERSLCFDFNDLPFEKIKTSNDLISSIKNFNYEKYYDDINNFQDYIGSYENGNASKLIADRIEKIINEGDEIKHEKV